MIFDVGVARRTITPSWPVELAGLGYYLHRTWERVRDDLTATALVVSDSEGGSAAIVAIDLMYNDRDFARSVREQVRTSTDLEPSSVCLNASHSHNAPTAGFIRGAGESEPGYLKFAAQQVAAAIIAAWNCRQPAHLYTGWTELPEMTYNRTRRNGLVDTRVSVLYAETSAGAPLVIAVNHHAHPCAQMEIDLRAVSRDAPGEVVDSLETAFPGSIALYLQGTCGDVNFCPAYRSTARCHEPARAVASAAAKAVASARRVDVGGVSTVCDTVTLPTRRWTAEEVNRDREEGLYRLETGDTAGWLDGIGRVIVNEPQRLPERYGGSVDCAVAAVARFAIEWTNGILPELNTRPETLDVEVQAIRVGDVYFAAHPAELFSSFGFDLRHGWRSDDLFVLGYSNGSIGYMPDEYDIERQSYAALTSPKCTGQFPFTADSGRVLVEGLEASLRRTESVLGYS
jgi:neutral ceramidase